jgi:hypothetical protein
MYRIARAGPQRAKHDQHSLTSQTVQINHKSARHRPETCLSLSAPFKNMTKMNVMLILVQRYSQLNFGM